MVLALGLAGLNCAPLFAQGTAGRILGTVTDTSGGAIAGVTVTVTDIDRNVPRTLMTDQSGAYSAPNLLPGNYRVRAEAKGFKAFERTGVILDVNAEVRVDLTMQPGEVSQTITVNESVPLVETTNAELSTTLQSSIIADIPLNGRNFENLLQLNPGVMVYPGGSGFTQSANGQRPHDNTYMVNGIMASDPWMGQSVFNAVMAAGDAGTIMPMDAIDEFKTEENPRAEYGWKPGAIVNVGVKSGTNSFHGSGYAYGRDTAFDARDFFNPANPPAGSGIASTKQPLQLEQFGGTAGGAIKKDKLFYFVNYEGQRYSVGNPSFIKTPTQAALTAACLGAGAGATKLSESLAGLTSACAIDPSKTTTDPGGLQFQGLFPVNSNGSVGADLPSVNSVNGGLGKINYHMNDKNQLEGMYFFSQGNNDAVDAPGSELSQAWTTVQHARSQAISADWAYTPNSTVVNELRFGYAHYYQTFFTKDSNEDPASYTFNGNGYEFPTGITNPLYFGAPDIRIQGFCAYPGGNCIGTGWPKVIGPDGVIEFLDHVSILKGKHAFKFGGEIIGNTSTEDETSNAKTQIRFGSSNNGLTSALTNFFDGDLKQAALFLGNPIRTFTNQGYAGFAQDDWRLTPRLTVNLGIRYELDTIVREKDGLMGNFDPIRGIYQTNTPYNGDHNNFAPRVGFAWDMFGNGKTVLRAAGGILYESLSFDVLNGVGNALGLRTIPTGLPLINAGNATPSTAGGSITLQSVSIAPGSPQLTGVGGANAAWQAFNPGAQVAGQATLFSSVSNPGCGDGFTVPTGQTTAPGPCEIYAVNPNLRTPYVSNWNLDIQRAITNNLSIDVGYVGNHGTKLLGEVNINQPAPGSGWNEPLTAAAISNDGYPAATPLGITPANLCTTTGFCQASATLEQASEPFTAPCAGKIAGLGTTSASGGVFNPTNSCFSYLNYITEVENSYESNYNGLQVTLTGRNYHGLSFNASYTYSHALGDASDQGTSADFPAPENSYGSLRQQLYSSTDFDIRHRFTASLDYAFPDKKGYGQALSGWSINLVAVVTSGLPWGMADLTNDFSGTNEIASTAQVEGEQWNFFGNKSDFTPVHGFTDTNGGWENGGGGLPFFAGTNNAANPTANATCNAKAAAIGPLASASLAAIGCYAMGNSVMIPAAYGSYGNMNPNFFRDGGFQNLDFSVAKLFTIHEQIKAQFRAEFFNILNHPHWVNPSGGPGGAIEDPNTQPFGAVMETPDTYSSNPQLGSGGPRAMQLGLKLSW